MNSYKVDKVKSTKRAVADTISQSAPGNAFQFTDNRPTATIQAKMKATIERSLPIQRKIHYKSGTYSSNSSRPGWRKFLKDFVVAEYNTSHGTSYTSKNINLNALHLDRCHRISFHDIQVWIVKYLNGNLSKAKFRERTERLYKSTSTDKPLMVAERNRLFAATTQSKKLASARALLSLLNSATGNVSLGNDSINRAIGKQLDVNFENKAGKQSLTPRSRGMLRRIPKSDTSGLPLTPMKTRVKSSHAAASIPIGNTTPATRNLLKKHTK